MYQAPVKKLYYMTKEQFMNGSIVIPVTMTVNGKVEEKEIPLAAIASKMTLNGIPVEMQYNYNYYLSQQKSKKTI
jgi:hypothetical protein